MVNHSNNKAVKLKAIRDDLDLNGFLNAARAAERASYQMKELEGCRTSDTRGREVSINKLGQQNQKYRQRGKTRSKSRKRIKNCLI